MNEELRKKMRLAHNWIHSMNFGEENQVIPLYVEREQTFIAGFEACYSELAPEIEKLKKQLEIAREAIGFYANKGSWNYTGMCSHEDNLKYVGPNCKFYDKHGTIKIDDIEEHNETLRFGGKKAREALEEMEGINENNVK